MKNLKIYENNCKDDVLSKAQLEKRHTEYNIGKTLFAVSDRGRKIYQDDSVIILEHPKNKDIKLIAVADGVSSRHDSELASNYVIKRLIEWFESINDYNPKEVKDELRLMLNSVLKGLRANIYAATTLSAAVVLKEETIIANIGDSRIYTTNNDELKQITRDDTEVQDLLDDELIVNKELTRFHKKNNILTAAIAFYPDYYLVKCSLIKNDYDKILVLTDGITNCLSTKQIENIIKNSKKEEIVKNLIKSAKILDSILDNEIKELPIEEQIAVIALQQIDHDYKKVLRGGIDNMSAAVYIRK